MNVTEFAAKRRTLQDEGVGRFRDIVKTGLYEKEAGDAEWMDGILTELSAFYREVYTSEAGTAPRRYRAGEELLVEKVIAALEKTEPDSDIDTVSLWLSLAAMNFATMAAADASDEPMLLTWTTMEDGAVREAHKLADGQTRPPGEPFDVGGVDMVAPGDPTAPIELWIGCRCVLRAEPASLTAADSGDHSDDPSLVIVALPAAGDPVHEIGDEQKHLTLAYIGSAASVDIERVADLVSLTAEQFGSPFPGTVSGTAALGPGSHADKAKVWMVESPVIQAIRDLLMADEAVAAGVETEDAHPHFVPHVTVGYDPEIDKRALEVTKIQFDRLAVWQGGTQTEFPLGDAMTAAAVEPEVEEVQPDATVTPELVDDRIPWHGVLAPENVLSGDRRMFKNLGRTRELPMPLTWQELSDDGHKGNITVAMIEWVEKRDGLLWAGGHFLSTVEEADEVVGLISEFGRYGISVDADDVGEASYDEGEDIEIYDDPRISATCIVSIPAFPEAFIKIGPDPARDTDQANGDLPEDVEPVAAAVEDLPELQAVDWSDIENFADIAPGRTEDGPGWLTNPVDTDRLRDYWVSGPGAAQIGWGTGGDFNRCRALTSKYVKPQHLNGYCANRHYDALKVWPGQHLSLEELPVREGEAAPALSLVAGGGKPKPPAAWFQDPKFTEPTPLTVTEDGRVFGHLAEWGICHISFDGKCTTAPPSSSNYAYFQTGQVLTEEGAVGVGQLTIGGGHAAPRLGFRPALAHYDSTSSAWADVAMGEDAFGIWFAGTVRPGATDEMIHAARASKISGDWRKVSGEFQLVAALSVNTAGFPVPRMSIKDGEQISLVAAGVVGRGDAEDDGVEQLAEAVAKQLEARIKRRERFAELQARVKKDH